MDIENETKQHNTFEKVVGLQTPMLLDEGTTVVHIGLNPLGLKHEHFHITSYEAFDFFGF